MIRLILKSGPAVAPLSRGVSPVDGVDRLLTLIPSIPLDREIRDDLALERKMKAQVAAIIRAKEAEEEKEHIQAEKKT